DRDRIGAHPIDHGHRRVHHDRAPQDLKRHVHLLSSSPTWLPLRGTYAPPPTPDGRRTVTVVPSPSTLSTAMLPRWASTICLTLARPRPLPPTPSTLEPRRNGAKTWGWSAAGMPRPRSRTSRTAHAPSAVATRSTRT